MRSLPVDRADGGDTVRVRHPLGEELVANLPCEHGGVLRLDPEDPLHNRWCRNLLLIIDISSIFHTSLEKHASLKIALEVSDPDRCPLYLWLGAADRARLHRAGLVEPGEDLGDAAVGDEELPRDVAGPHSHHGELDDPAADIVGQRPPVHEDAAQLVHARLT